MPSGFRRAGTDSFTSSVAGEYVGRTYERNDGSAVGLIASRASSPEAAQAGCVGLVKYAESRGLSALSASNRGDDGVVLVGRMGGQPSIMVLFRLGVFCGGATMIGPIVATGTADLNADAQLKHILDVMERRALAWPDGFR